MAAVTTSGSRTPNTSTSTASDAGITATHSAARTSFASSSIRPTASNGPMKAPTESSDCRKPKAAPRCAAGVMPASKASRGAPRMPLPTRSTKRAANTASSPCANGNTGFVSAASA